MFLKKKNASVWVVGDIIIMVASSRAASAVVLFAALAAQAAANCEKSVDEFRAFMETDDAKSSVDNTCAFGQADLSLSAIPQSAEVAVYYFGSNS